jgi:integrase
MGVDMAKVKWHREGSKETGWIYFKKHPTRKHGVQFDKYRRAEYQHQGARVSINFGWESEGWTLLTCQNRLKTYKKNAKAGKSPISLKEEREIEARKKAEAQTLQDEQKRAEITFSEVWDRYKAQAIADRGDKAIETESGLYKNWIMKDLAGIAIRDISPFHLEKIKSKMAKKGRAPRSIEYTLAIVRQVFNYARRTDLFAGDNPVSKVKIPRKDNRRVRFLTHEEADTLLNALMKVSKQVHDIALLSLHTGMRAGEIFSLTWGCVDLEAGIITLKPEDTKNKTGRPVFVTQAVKDLLAEIKPGDAGRDDLVFPGRGGVKIEKPSKTFTRVAADLFNKGVDDSRQRVVFHTLRHTYASWLVMEGVDLYRVKELLGHKDLTMTARYSHLAPDTLRGAVNVFEAALKPIEQDAGVIPIQQKA